MEKINFQASTVWAYARCLTGTERIELARNDLYGVQIFLELEGSKPLLSAYADDNLEEEHIVTSKDDCELTVQYYYEHYLSGQFAMDVDYDDIPEEVTEDDYAEEIERRECELDDAVMEFISNVMTDGVNDEMSIEDFDELISETKEAFLSFLAIKMGLTIYRPTIVEMSNGEEVYIDYPYEFVDMNKSKQDKKETENGNNP